MPVSGAGRIRGYGPSPLKAYAAGSADFAARESGRTIELDGLAVSVYRLQSGVWGAGASGHSDTGLKQCNDLTHQVVTFL